MIGDRYGNRVVISSTYRRNKCHYVDTRCDCGSIGGVPLYILRSGKSTKCKSCDNKIITNKTHGKSQTRLYRIWSNIKNRCYNPNRRNYRWYGARGIKMCDEWKRNFVDFHEWSVKNGYQDKLTIDRIDRDGDYEPGNCRWATIKEQQSHRISNRVITYEGKTMILEDWKRTTGLGRDAILRRISNNKPLLLDAPIHPHEQTKKKTLEYHSQETS